MNILRLALSALLCFALASCEKEEAPLSLPPKGSARMDRVDMGSDYSRQFYYDFEKGGVVYQTDARDWDLAFESGYPGARHVFINGSNQILLFRTRDTTFYNRTTVPSLAHPDWDVDASCGLPDSTALGEWMLPSGASKQEVYVLQMGYAPNSLKLKMKLLLANEFEYVFVYMPLNNSGPLQSVTIPKDPAYNYTYFSFNHGLVMQEPPKDSYDIVFTQYRTVFMDKGEKLPYLVSGVLLNPWKTTVMTDSVTAFAQLGMSHAAAGAFTNFRDGIGYNWKDYEPNSGRYHTKSEKGYIIRNRKGQYWKMHFLNFYNPHTGEAGSPSFEYERLQ